MKNSAQSSLTTLVNGRQIKSAAAFQVILAVFGVAALTLRTLPQPAFSLVTWLVFGQVVTVYLLLAQAVRERCPATLMAAGAFVSTLVGFNLVPPVLERLGYEAATVYPIVAFAAQSFYAGWFVLFSMMEGFCRTKQFTIPEFIVRGGAILALSAAFPFLISWLLVSNMAMATLEPRVLLALTLVFSLAAYLLFARKTTKSVSNLALRTSLLCSLIDAGLVAFSPAHSFGTFEAQIFGFIACTIVPAVFLIEFNAMYARLAQEAKTFQRQALHDPLTGVGNRRAYEALIEMRVGDLDRGIVKQLGVIVVDIDDFKTFNDTYGHAAGDRCLVKIATAIELATPRPGDSVFRLGGEEFVVVLPFSGDGPNVVAERVRRGVYDLNIRHTGSACGRVTVSVGVAVAPDQGKSGSELFANADLALYQAKAQGKNCVRVSRAYAEASAVAGASSDSPLRV